MDGLRGAGDRLHVRDRPVPVIEEGLGQLGGRCRDASLRAHRLRHVQPRAAVRLGVRQRITFNTVLRRDGGDRRVGMHLGVDQRSVQVEEQRAHGSFGAHESIDQRAVVLERRRGQAADLALVVELAQQHRFAPMRFCFERALFRCAHRSALQFERRHRSGTELPHVRRIGGAQIALRRNMQSHGFGHFGAEMSGQPACAALFMRGVVLPIGDVGGRRLDKMADVVQERRQHQRIGRAVCLREIRRLQAVLRHRHRFAVVGAGAARRVDRQQFLRRARHGECLCSCARSRAVLL